jgi:hypothetical protein
VNGGVDVFYRRHKDVIRHRFNLSGDNQEFTTKLNTRRNSTVNRLEPDVGINSPPEDAGYFAQLIGFRKDLSLVKDNEIFELKDPKTGCPVCVSLYRATGVDGKALNKSTQTFIEIEVAKSASIDEPKAMEIIGRWRAMLNAEFKLGDPLSKSLYQLFGGKGYRSARTAPLKASWNSIRGAF